MGGPGGGEEDLAAPADVIDEHPQRGARVECCGVWQEGGGVMGLALYGVACCMLLQCRGSARESSPQADGVSDGPTSGCTQYCLCCHLHCV